MTVNHQHYVYRCTANVAAPGRCIGTSIGETALIGAVSDQLRQYAENSDDMDELKDLYENLVLSDLSERAPNIDTHNPDHLQTLLPQYFSIFAMPFKPIV